jgi:hypothetical protein
VTGSGHPDASAPHSERFSTAAGPGRGRRGGLATWLAVLGCLAVVDLAIACVFVPRVLVPRFTAPGHVLRDMTWGHNLSVLFTLAERRVAAAERSVALVGDSTVMRILLEPDRDLLSAQLADALNRRDLGGRPVEVIEFGFYGLPAEDAAVVIAKALAIGTDLVIYAMTPRIVCRLGRPATDAARYALDWDVASRLGMGFVWRSFGPEALVASAVRSRWQLLRFRRELKAGIAHQIALRLPQPWAATVMVEPYLAPLLDEGGQRTGPLWTRERCQLDTASAGVAALIRIADMCAAAGRCLLYHGPVNPQARWNFEDGLLPDFIALVRRLTNERHVPFRDYSDSVPASGFSTGSIRRPDPIHLSAAGRAPLVESLADEAARALR